MISFSSFGAWVRVSVYMFRYQMGRWWWATVRVRRIRTPNEVRGDRRYRFVVLHWDTAHEEDENKNEKNWGNENKQIIEGLLMLCVR